MFVENQIFNLFGVPAICITDNAKVFKSDAFAKLLKTYDVTHWNLAVYHPSPNPVERVNRDHREWDRSIHQIAQAIRTTVHDSTGHTPFFINFGRNMISSGAEYDFLRKSEDAARCPLKLSEEMKQLFGIVRQNLMKAYQKYSRTYNLRANAKHNFEPGHIVFKKNINLSDKSRDYSTGTRHGHKCLDRQPATIFTYLLIGTRNDHPWTGTRHGRKFLDRQPATIFTSALIGTRNDLSWTV
ncbi:uncharacterized protein LOC134289842 [Aedes albopictus]|uniref:Integrase catalytic domain-containing protein n=1 Tax=Aedes albopictus TaxID=7160 RepID=A0ABM1XPG8_AEDAL